MNRSFQTSFHPTQLKDYQNGVMSYEYRGVLCNKSPIDIAIYTRLIYEQKPNTIIEIGTKNGGSAILLRDLSKITGKLSNIVSIDVNKPENVPYSDDILFISGNAKDLDAIFANYDLMNMPRPWLVIEDSAHDFETCFSVLEFFEPNLNAGEYLVMEDGILDELGMSDQYSGGPNRAINEFISNSPGVYEIDPFYCDMFGKNLTYNPNGYLKRI